MLGLLTEGRVSVLLPSADYFFTRSHKALEQFFYNSHIDYTIVDIIAMVYVCFDHWKRYLRRFIPFFCATVLTNVITACLDLAMQNLSCYDCRRLRIPNK